MSEADVLVQQAKQAMNAKDKVKARELLLKAVDLDERHEQAWLWLSGVSGSVDEQIICLENVMSINPANEKAKQGLDRLKTSSGRAAAPPPAAPPLNDPFAGLSFDSDPSNPFGGGWNDQGKPAAPAAYGSGRQVEQPSAEQYDDWISSMPIGKTTDSPFGAPLADPFASPPPSDDPWAGLNVGSSANDPFGSTRSAAPPPPAPMDDDPWNSAPTNAWETKSVSSRKPAAPDPFTGAPSVPAFTAVDFGNDSYADADIDPFASTRGATPASSPSFESMAPTGSSDSSFASPSDFKFDFEDNFFGAGEFDDAAFGEVEADTSDPFAEVDTKKKAKKASKTTKKPAVQVSPHFASLPDEFKRSGGSNSRLMAAVAVMGILNVLALVGVVLAL